MTTLKQMWLELLNYRSDCKTRIGDGFYFPNTHLPRLRIFDTLKANGVFGDFKLGNGNIMDVEGIESVRLKLHDASVHMSQDARLLMPTSSLWRDETT